MLKAAHTGTNQQWANADVAAITMMTTLID